MAKAALTDRTIQSLRTAKAQEDFVDENFKAHGTFGVRVSGNGRKTFFLIYRVGNRQRRLNLGTYPAVGLADARKEALGKVNELNAGVDPAEKRDQAKLAETFGELVAEFFRFEEQKLKPSTVAAYRGMLKRDLLPRWGKMRANEVKRAHVLQLTDEIYQERKSPIMANRTLALISRLFNFGIARDLLDFNPAQKVPKPGKENRGERVLSWDEMRNVWNATERENPIFRGVYRLLLLTGQRPGEVTQMEWSDIDGDKWTIPASKSKNSRKHSVHLSPQSQAVLADLRESGASSHKYIFPGWREGKPVRELDRARDRLIKAMDCPLWNPHDLRRTVQTRMAEMGIRPDIVDRVLNHNVRGVRANYDQYNYYPETRAALIRWGAEVERVYKRKPDERKVVNLR